MTRGFENYSLITIRVLPVGFGNTFDTPQSDSEDEMDIVVLSTLIHCAGIAYA